MTAITYSILTGSKTTSGSLKNWVNRTDIPSDFILTEAESYIYEKLRVREMITSEAITFSSSGANSCSFALSGLDNTFLDPVSFTPYTWGSPLAFKNEGIVKPYRDEDGNLTQSETPSYWYIEGETAYVDVDLTANLSGIMQYYYKPEALSGANETNFLTTRYPTALRRACLAYAYEHMKDSQRMQEYFAMAEKAIMEANSTNEMFRRNQDAG